MPFISEMPPPGPLTGLELVPALQGGGAAGNRGIPLLATGAPFGGAVLTLRAPVTADLASTSDGDPGAGGIRWNDADPGQATTLYVSDEDLEAGDLGAALGTLATGGFIYLQGGADSEARNNLQKWQVTSVTAGSGYTKVGVTLQAAGGAFADLDPVELTIQQPLPTPGVDRNVVTSVSSVAGVLTVDASLGDYFRVALAEDVSSLVVTNSPPGATLAISFTQDSTPWEIEWPGSWNWGEGGAAPAMPAAAGAVLDVIITTLETGAVWIASWRVRA